MMKVEIYLMLMKQKIGMICDYHISVHGAAAIQIPIQIIDGLFVMILNSNLMMIKRLFSAQFKHFIPVVSVACIFVCNN